jgi:hypothetical protein
MNDIGIPSGIIALLILIYFIIQILKWVLIIGGIVGCIFLIRYLINKYKKVSIK